MHVHSQLSQVKDVWCESFTHKSYFDKDCTFVICKTVIFAVYASLEAKYLIDVQMELGISCGYKLIDTPAMFYQVVDEVWLFFTSSRHNENLKRHAVDKCSYIILKRYIILSKTEVFDIIMCYCGRAIWPL